MSEIWLAEQIALARPVAVKIVSLGEEADARLSRFRQEAALIARFDHPNVVGIIEFGETGDGRLYFSMPYVPNGTLAESSLHGDSPRVREVLTQILDALAYVHQHGVVHRDVKPENVLFDSVGRARLADFGVSRSIESVSRHTRVGETFGSSHYMSPEQARGEMPDGRSDLYSVGALAHELLTGHTPYEGPDHLSIVVAHLQAPVPKLPAHLRHWQSWIDSALAKRPEHRFADAVAMRAALARLPDGTASRSGWITRLRKPGVGLAAVAVGAVGLALALWWLAVADRSEQQASIADASAGPDVAGSPPAGNRSAPAVPPEPDAAGASTRGVAQSDSAQAASSSDSPRQSAGSPDATVATPSGSPGAVDAVKTPPDGAAERTRPAPVAGGAAAGRAPSPQPAQRRPPPVAARPSTPATLAFAGSFESVPRVPLFLLAGTRDQQLQRIDDYLENGRRAIDADRANVERLRRETDDRDLRARLRTGYDARKANYETWRRQLLDLRKQAQRLDR